MEIAIGVVFLALFAGAFFLLILIIAFYFWRRRTRRNAEQNRQFTSAATYGAVGSSGFDASDDDYIYSDTANYSDSSSEGNKEVSGAMSYESPTEGGGYTSSDSGSSSSYDSGSSSSDSGSSSSSSD